MKKLIKPLLIIVFCVYLLYILKYTVGLYLLGIRQWFHHDLIVRGIGFSPEFNLIPFTNTATVTFLLNILLFVPFGLLLPLILKVKTVGKVMMFGVVACLIVEFLQIGIQGRITDINDLIANAVGTLVGYYIYKFGKKILEG